jgi:hypothetical protein
MIVEIISGLWIGTLEELQNKTFLNDMCIEVVFNCTLSHPSPPQIETIRVPVTAMNEPSRDFLLLKQNLSKILGSIHQSLEKGNIFIVGHEHCSVPMIITALYLIYYGKLNKDQIRDSFLSKQKNLHLEHDLSYFI